MLPGLSSSVMKSGVLTGNNRKQAEADVQSTDNIYVTDRNQAIRSSFSDTGLPQARYKSQLGVQFQPSNQTQPLKPTDADNEEPSLTFSAVDRQSQGQYSSLFSPLLLCARHLFSNNLVNWSTPTSSNSSTAVDPGRTSINKKEESTDNFGGSCTFPSESYRPYDSGQIFSYGRLSSLKKTFLSYLFSSHLYASYTLSLMVIVFLVHWLPFGIMKVVITFKPNAIGWKMQRVSDFNNF